MRLVDARLFGDGLCGGLVVSGQHDRGDPQGVKLGDARSSHQHDGVGKATAAAALSMQWRACASELWNPQRACRGRPWRGVSVPWRKKWLTLPLWQVRDCTPLNSLPREVNARIPASQHDLRALRRDGEPDTADGGSRLQSAGGHVQALGYGAKCRRPPDAFRSAHRGGLSALLTTRLYLKRSAPAHVHRGGY